MVLHDAASQLDLGQTLLAWMVQAPALQTVPLSKQHLPEQVPSVVNGPL